jgi:PKHD-type hydroxylase
VNFLPKIHCNLFFERKNFLSQDEINTILRLKTDQHKSIVHLNERQVDVDSKIRSSYTSWINLENCPNVLYKINSLVDEINNTHWRFKINYLGESSIVSYLDKKDNYGWHIDWSSNLSSCNRKISVLIQLSDPNNYKGCNLQIKISKFRNFTFSTELGSILIFPSFLLHRATKLISGERDVLVLWYHGDSFV